MQIQAGDPANAKYKGPMDCAKQLYKEEGLFRGIYRGTGATLLRGIFVLSNEFHSMEVPLFMNDSGDVDSELLRKCFPGFFWS